MGMLLIGVSLIKSWLTLTLQGCLHCFSIIIAGHFMVYGLHILEMISALRMVFYCSAVFNMFPVSFGASHQMALFSDRQAP